jgi:hypothetical protein
MTLRIAPALLRFRLGEKGIWGDTPHAPRQLLHFLAGALDETHHNH